ncbi:acyl-CoA thioesterase [Pseudomonas sp. ABC1]|uniref:acyl-CoA thioesterase n=1 Tax=Pseudomonas sp. ABC1 TaxID=2748080 RepID=UPI0015C3B320|nr:thioesterase family protein [Pseudomonas sp. ABC1]QLF93692.1 acyl-CoA thioesterase [Pseudomonas sp. ABC1]
MSTPGDIRRSDYHYRQPITTRWQDNDLHGHVSNAAYYGFFDSAVNTYLIEHGGLDIHDGEVVAFMVSSSCDYFSSLSFPDVVDVALRVSKLASSSVEYELAVFRSTEETPAALGRFVHVFVDRTSNQPATIPPRLRQALENIRSQQEPPSGVAG